MLALYTRGAHAGYPRYCSQCDSRRGPQLGRIDCHNGKSMILLAKAIQVSEGLCL
jgi:hypothetical protein